MVTGFCKNIGAGGRRQYFRSKGGLGSNREVKTKRSLARQSIEAIYPDLPRGGSDNETPHWKEAWTNHPPAAHLKLRKGVAIPVEPPPSNRDCSRVDLERPGLWWPCFHYRHGGLRSGKCALWATTSYVPKTGATRYVCEVCYRTWEVDHKGGQGVPEQRYFGGGGGGADGGADGPPQKK